MRAPPGSSLKQTRYGRLCKPGLRQSHYRREPGLQSLPPRAALLERRTASANNSSCEP